MKALKINTPIPTTFGVEVPSGSLLVVAESYTQQGLRQETEIDGVKHFVFPAQVSFNIFANTDAYNSQKTPVEGLVIPTTMTNLWLREALYATVPAEVLILAAIKERLEATFPEAIEEVSI